MATREAMMTNKERVYAMFRGEKPDRVPIWPFALGFSGIYSGMTIEDIYNKPALSLEAQRKTCHEFGWMSTPLIYYAIFGGYEFGGEIKWPTGEYAQAPSIMKRFVETPEEAMKLTLPDVKNAGIIPKQIEIAKLALEGRDDNEPFRLLFQLDGTFNVAANIVSVTKLTKWMIKKPEVAHHILRLATDFLVELAQYVKDTFGTDEVAFFGSEPSAANQMISPKHFEEFAFPYRKETQEKVLAMGFKNFVMHICGEQNLNLPYWAQTPMGDPGFVTFGPEVDLDTAAKYFPKCIIVGNVQTALIQIGTAEEVYEATKKVVLQGKQLSNGFILGPGCEMPPKAPVENIRALTQAVEDFGWYD